MVENRSVKTVSLVVTPSGGAFTVVYEDGESRGVDDNTPALPLRSRLHLLLEELERIIGPEQEQTLKEAGLL